LGLRLLLGALLVSLLAAGCGSQPSAAVAGRPAASTSPASPGESNPPPADGGAATDAGAAGRDAATTGEPSGGLGPTGYPATLYVEHDVRVTARQPGVIEAVMVDRGAVVTAGQALARVETDSASQAVTLADADARLAKTERDRLAPLAEQKIVSAQDLERAQTALERAEARAALARTELEQCTVVAPFGGTVLERWAVVGQRVTDDVDSPPLFRVAARGPLRARVDVPEAALGTLRRGGSARIEPAGVAARVVFVGAAVDPVSGTAPVIVELSSGAPSLRLGSAVQVRFGGGGA